MKFTLEIELGNDAMQTWTDVQDVIESALEPSRRRFNTIKGGHIPMIGDGGKIMDDNGNSVGKWEVSE